MKNFQASIYFSLLLCAILPVSTFYVVHAFLPEGWLRFVSFGLILFGALVCAYEMGSKLVKPLQRSTDKFDRLIAGKTDGADERSESEIEELGRIRKAISFLINEQRSAGEKLKSLVSDLAQSKGDLETSNNFLNAIFESAPVGILVVDTKENVITSNQVAKDFLGYPLREGQRIRKDFCNLFDDPDKVDIIWNEGQKTPWSSLQCDVRTADERNRYFQLFAVPLCDSKGHAFARLWIIHDETERRILAAEVLQTNKLEAVGQLAGGVAHDFNNLLTAIRGNIELVLSDKDILPADDLERLDEAFEAARTASSIVSQMLGFSRKGSLTIERVCLNQVVHSTQRFVSRMLNPKVQLLSEIHKDNCIADADSTQIQQILMNLCVNARDAMPPQGGEIWVRSGIREFSEEDCNASVPSRVPGRFVALSVEDSGTGISEENLSKIFDPFFTTKANGEGTGLGLATCYGIAAQHGGWIECESVVGEGTTFTLFIPAAAPSKDGEAIGGETSITQKIALPRETQESLEGGTALVIDDEDSVRRVATMALRKFGFEVLTAEGGREGIDLYTQRQDEIDIVIVDRNMPNVGGEEVFAALVDLNPGVKVIVCSGYLINLQEFATEDGVIPSAMIQKPYKIPDLITKVNEVLHEEVVLPS